jgi:ABC-2 type transport system ATP-binding protein
MIRVSNLAKCYGATLALDGLTLTVPEGAVFGLLGPNASGKSTLIKLLMGFIFPDRGEIDLGKLSPRQIGYVPERLQLPTRALVAEYLALMGKLSGLRGMALGRAVEAALHQVGLADVATQRIQACSKGMLQRVALAQACISNPPFLLLDEPMSGLDPLGQKEMRELIVALGKQGKTVLFSTHRLSEVGETCSHLAILNRGKLVRTGTLADVLPLKPRVTIAVDHLPEGLRRKLVELSDRIRLTENTIILHGDAAYLKSEVLRLLLEAQRDVQSLVHERATLEQVYLEAMRS